MTIDMHAHWSPPELLDMYRARTEPPMIYAREDGTEVIKTGKGEQTIDGMFDDLLVRLAEMDEYGVGVGVLSLWGPHQWIERLPAEEAEPLVCAFNDSVSRVCQDHPGRFIAYASLPLADLDAAVAEFDRATDAVAGVDVVYTDVWTSMGQEAESARRMQAFEGYRVSSALMDLAGPDAFFMHCLPAHRGEEVTESVIDGPQSIVWDEAENRLHVQKGILAWCLS